MTIGTLEESGLCTLVGLTALETALGRVLTGAGKGIGWGAGLEIAGVGLLETGGVVLPMGGVVIVVLGLLETGVLLACGVDWAAGVAGVVLEPEFGVAVGGVTVTGLTGGLETVFGAATVTGFKPSVVLAAVCGVSRLSGLGWWLGLGLIV